MLPNSLSYFRKREKKWKICANAKAERQWIRGRCKRHLVIAVVITVDQSKCWISETTTKWHQLACNAYTVMVCLTKDCPFFSSVYAQLQVLQYCVCAHTIRQTSAHTFTERHWWCLSDVYVSSFHASSAISFRLLQQMLLLTFLLMSHKKSFLLEV